MGYQCPYCDGRIINPRKNCPNCGASSGSFVKVEEVGDTSDTKQNLRRTEELIDNKINKALGKREDRFIDKFGRVALFILSLSVWIWSEYALVIWIVTLVTYNIKNLNLKKGLGKTAFFLTIGEIVLCVVILIVVIMLWQLGLLDSFE